MKGGEIYVPKIPSLGSRSIKAISGSQNLKS